MRVVTLLAVGLVAFAAEASGPTLAVDLADVSTDAGVLLRVHGSVGDGSLGVPVAGGGDLDGDRFVDYAFASMRASPPSRPGQASCISSSVTGRSLARSTPPCRVLTCS
jgi:hypothetical protein